MIPTDHVCLDNLSPQEQNLVRALIGNLRASQHRIKSNSVGAQIDNCRLHAEIIAETGEGSTPETALGMAVAGVRLYLALSEHPSRNVQGRRAATLYGH